MEALLKDQSTLTDYYREFAADGETHSMDYVYERTVGVVDRASPQTGRASRRR